MRNIFSLWNGSCVLRFAVVSPPSPLNILLAEDERSVAFSILFALKADGHKIQIVRNGEEALSELKRKSGEFDLLITDHSMPRMNGMELVKRLRDAVFPGKIVVLSAHLSAENRAAYVALGVDMMVPKPFDVHELRAAIRQIGSGRETSALPASEVYRLLRLGLPETEANSTADTSQGGERG